MAVFFKFLTLIFVVLHVILFIIAGEVSELPNSLYNVSALTLLSNSVFLTPINTILS